ncbi:AaceriACR186Wp [[Ashbya] aceris (nom. inval.)]|nr:AaceriACR186Wp [[Ashbya] aceris (nom. inval.)]
MSSVSRRYISLVKPGSSGVPPIARLIAPNAAAKDLFPSEELGSTRFELLGESGTLARASVPPGVSLYVRRGCMVSLYNRSGLRDIAMSHQWLQPAVRMLRYRSLKASIYYRLSSPAHLNCLLAPNFTSQLLWRVRPAAGRTLCPLTLDGTSDWFVFGRDAVVAYESNSSLVIQEGPFRRPFRRAHPLGSKLQLLQGRGSLLLSGYGTVYRVDLKDAGDELILQRRHLLAVNGTAPADIHACASPYDMLPPVPAARTAPPLVSFGENRRIHIAWSNFGLWLSAHASHIRSVVQHLYSRYLHGPSDFVKIRGPRTLMVQSMYSGSVPLPGVSGRSAHQPLYTTDMDSLPELKVSDAKNYLSYASVGPDGKVSFRSTSDFKDTVKQIELAKKKR